MTMDYRTPEELHDWLRRQGHLNPLFAAGPGGRPLMSPPPFGPGLPLGGVPMELPSRVPPPPPFGPVPIAPTVRMLPPPPPRGSLLGGFKDKADVAKGFLEAVTNPASALAQGGEAAGRLLGKIVSAIDVPARAAHGMISAATYIPGVMGQKPPARFLTPGQAVEFQKTLPFSERLGGEMIFDPLNVIPVAKAGELAQLLKRGQAAAPPPGITRTWEFLQPPVPPPAAANITPPRPQPGVPGAFMVPPPAERAAPTFQPMPGTVPATPSPASANLYTPPPRFGPMGPFGVRQPIPGPSAGAPMPGQVGARPTPLGPPGAFGVRLPVPGEPVSGGGSEMLPRAVPPVEAVPVTAPAAAPTPVTPQAPVVSPTAQVGVTPQQAAAQPIPGAAAPAAGAAPAPPSAAPIPNSFYQRMPFDSYWQDAKRVLYEKQVGGPELLQKAVGMFEPARAIQDPVQEIGITKALFESRETSRIRSLVNAEYATDRPLFGFKGDKALAVTMKPGLDPSLVDHPASRTLADMVEHRELYSFTPEQAKAVDRWEATFDESLREVNASGVPWDEIGEAYYPHIIKKKPGDTALDALINPPGYKPGMPRKYKDVRSMIDEGFELDLNPRTSSVTRLEAGMRAVSRRETLNRLKEFPEIRIPGSGASPRFGEQEFLGRFAPREFVEKVDKWVDLPGLLGQKARRGDSTAMEALSLARSLKTTFDNGVLFTQGQALFYRDPMAWGKMAVKSFQALISDPSDYWRKNIDIIDEGHKVGAISRPAEYLVSEEGLGALVSKAPVIGPVIKGFNRAFETGVIVGQTELYKGIRQGVQNEDDLISMGSAVSKILGTEDYARLGVGRTQQNAEQLAFFASRFMRANVGLMAQAFTPGPGGDQARKALGSLIVGATGITLGLNAALHEDLPSTDPDSSTWMKVKVGDSFINMYGPFYPYFRQIARMGKHGVEGDIGAVTADFINTWKPKLSTPVQAGEITAHLLAEGEKQHYGETIDVSPGGIGTMAKELFAPISTAETIEGLTEGRPEALLTPVIPSMTGPTRSTEREEFRNILGLSHDQMEKEGELGTLVGYMGGGEKPKIEGGAFQAAKEARINDMKELATRPEFAGGGLGGDIPSWAMRGGGGGDDAGFKFRNEYYAIKNRWIGATNNIFREEEEDETREEYLARPPRQKNYQPIPASLLPKLAAYNPKEYYRIMESWMDTRNFIANMEHIPVEQRVKMINFLVKERFPEG